MAGHKVGARRVSLALFFLIALALAACAQSAPTPSADPVARWIQQPTSSASASTRLFIRKLPPHPPCYEPGEKRSNREIW